MTLTHFKTRFKMICCLKRDLLDWTVDIMSQSIANVLGEQCKDLEYGIIINQYSYLLQILKC